jgi:hypothetical protein
MSKTWLPAASLDERVDELEIVPKKYSSNTFLASDDVELYNKALANNALKIKDSKLGPPEVVEERINEYFMICQETHQFPSIKALSLYIGVPFATLKGYLNDPTSRYYNMLSVANDLCHVILEQGAINNKVNPATYMFTAANYYGMKNTQSVEIGHRTSTETDLGSSREAINALKDLLARDKNDDVVVKEAVIIDAKDE